MTDDIKLTGKNNAGGQIKVQKIAGIPYAVLKISDEEFRVAVANAKLLTDTKNFNPGKAEKRS